MLSENVTKPFTLHGSSELERRIGADVRDVISAVRRVVPAKALKAIWLGGGFGRGEGGVRRVGDVELPYNDYDFFVVTAELSRIRRWWLKRKLRDLEAELTLEFGVEVEIAHLTAGRLAHLSSLQLWVDLRFSARTVWGDPKWVDRIPAFSPKQIPVFEATRLLINRAALLLMATRQQGAADEATLTPERVDRWIRKGVLACGDAMLLAQGTYRTGWLERVDQVASDNTIDPWIKDNYLRAVHERLTGERVDGGFDESPDMVSTLTRHMLTTLLWVESIRLDRSFLPATANTIGRYAERVMHTDARRSTMARLGAALPAILYGPETAMIAQELLFGTDDPAAMFVGLWRAL